MSRANRGSASNMPELRASSYIKDLFQFEHCIFAGRGRSALALAFTAADVPNGSPVILPSNICPSVIASVICANMEPHVIPVQSETGLPDEGDALKLLTETKGRGFLLIAHLYGLYCAHHELVKEAKRRRWIVIESDTLATTAYTQVERLESDATILSFGSGKSIDACSGGALLLHDTAYAQSARRVISDWQPLNDEDNAIEDHLILHRRALRERKQSSLYSGCLLSEIAQIPRNFNIDWDLLINALSGLHSKRARAIENWDQWSQLLSGSSLILLSKPLFPWRFIAVVGRPESRHTLLSELREENINVGTNYPSVTQFFPSFFTNKSPPMRDNFGDRVINLWLTDSNSNKTSRIVTAIAGNP